MAKVEKKAESQLLAEVTAAIEQVDEGRRERFIATVATYFGVVNPTVPRGEAKGGLPAVRHVTGQYGEGSGDQPNDRGFAAFEDLFDQCNPATQSDKALVGGYWVQVLQDQPAFTGQEVNTLLKNVGHGVGNITDAFTHLQEFSPALARQVAKSGKARQARKKYKLTTPGVSRVKKLMSAGSEGDE